MSNLVWAEWWANHGFRIFPIAAGDKKPPIFKHFGSRAMTHIEAVRRWWSDNPLYNIGIVMDGYVCVDADVYKNPDVLEELALKGVDLQKTLSQKTARDGRHAIYTSLQQYRSRAGVRHGVDIKSGPDAYIAGAGSVTLDGVYELLTTPNLIQPLPAEMATILEPWGPAEQAAALARHLATKIDDPASIIQYQHFCMAVHPAIEGRHGDQQTYMVAAMGVKDYALSPRTTYDVMRTHFNPRCEPPWDEYELQTKVLNGFEYGTHPIGVATPELMFQNIRVRKAGLYPEPTRMIDWTVRELLIPGHVTVIAGVSSAGKSTLVAALVAHTIAGQNMGPFTMSKPAAVITLNTEDEAWITHNRVFAVLKRHNWAMDENIKKNVLVLDKTDTDDESMIIKINRRLVLNPKFEERIEQWIKELPHVNVLILDPLPNLHEAEENNNDEMAQVMTILNRIADKYEIAVLVLHHAGKPVSNVETSARGASSILGRPRLAFTLTPHETLPNTVLLRQVKKTHGPKIASYILTRDSIALADNGEQWVVIELGETEQTSAEAERSTALNALGEFMNITGKTTMSMNQAASQISQMVDGISASTLRSRGRIPGKLDRWLTGRPHPILVQQINGTTITLNLSFDGKNVMLV